jgi:hypothetical protein
LRGCDSGGATGRAASDDYQVVDHLASVFHAITPMRKK